MSAPRPTLPKAEDLPEIEVDDEALPSALPADWAPGSSLSAETEISDTPEEMSVKSFEDAPQPGPLDFDDGGEMGRPQG